MIKGLGPSRRDILGSGAAAFVASGLPAAALAAAASTRIAGTPDWWRRPTRWLQLIMVENDPQRYDLGWWRDFMARTRISGLCLSAGGLTAYYPSSIPYHHVSNAMKPGDDPFGDFVRFCRQHDIVVVARTDSHTVLEDAAKAHPEWLNIDENGKPRRHPNLPDTRFVTCAFGPYNFDFMTDVHREIAARYQVDGLFCNRWQGGSLGMCYCDSCKTQFRAFANMDLPRGGDAQASPRYAEWVQSRLVSLWKIWDGVVREYNGNARYFTNTGLPLDVEAKLSPVHLIERQVRTSEPIWAFAMAAKECRAIMGRSMPLIGLTSITSQGQARLSVTSDAEQGLWLASAIANDLQPWFLKTSAVVDDTRWLPHIERLYPWHARNQAYLDNVTNLARVALMFDGEPSGPRNPVNTSGGNAMAGWYQALLEAGIPFELVHRPKLSAEDLKSFGTLILPNITNLSDQDCEIIRQFVRSGGNLVATFESSINDANGKKRADFGLADLFGASYVARKSSGTNAYMNVDQAKHPLMQGLEGAARLVASSNHIEVRLTGPSQKAVLTRLPPVPWLPMEEIYPRVAHTDIPEVVLRSTGAGGGRVAYVPGDLDRTFSASMLAEHGLLLRNLVKWATREPQAVAIEGEGVIDVTYWRQKSSVTVHLVNMTNPMMLRAPIRELIPIGEQTVTIQLPPGLKPRRARLLVADRTAAMTRSGGAVTVTVPQILDHEVIAIDV